MSLKIFIVESIMMALYKLLNKLFVISNEESELLIISVLKIKYISRFPRIDMEL
jgi:hypothetical protein